MKRRPFGSLIQRPPRPRPALDGSDPVFTDNEGKGITPSCLRRMYEPTVARCEVLPVAKRHALRFHDLRHTAASLMVSGGVPIFDVATILGHSNVSVTMRYAHFAPEAGRAARGTPRPQAISVTRSS